MCISYCLFLIFSMFSTCCTWKFSIYSAASCTVTFRVSKTTCDSIEQLTTSLKGKVALIFLFAAAHAQLACTWMRLLTSPLSEKHEQKGRQPKLTTFLRQKLLATNLVSSSRSSRKSRVMGKMAVQTTSLVVRGFLPLEDATEHSKSPVKTGTRWASIYIYIPVTSRGPPYSNLWR